MQSVHLIPMIIVIVACVIVFPVNAENMHMQERSVFDIQNPFDGGILSLFEMFPLSYDSLSHDYYIFERNEDVHSVYTNEGIYLINNETEWERIEAGHTYSCEEEFNGVLLTNCRETEKEFRQIWVQYESITDYKEWKRCEVVDVVENPSGGGARLNCIW